MHFPSLNTWIDFVIASSKEQLEARFTIERLRASERIMGVTKLHDEQFSAKMKVLNIC